MGEQSISTRKDDHLSIVNEQDVAFHHTSTLLEQVGLIHECLPDLALDDIDTSSIVLGKRLRVPLIVAGMTGGSPRAREINRTLAKLADERGYGFGLGSQRAMLVRPELTDTYQVREDAPEVLVLGNLGIIQARELPTDEIDRMVREVGADALCVHMNPAMELVQPEGDRDFTGGLATFGRLVKELRVPVIAKETGCGISWATARRLRGVGVEHVDVSGAGGTSWVAVETERAQGQARRLGEALREWGIPTAASVLLARQAGMKTVVATGGIGSGLDVARAVVLGASAAGIARHVFRALLEGGPQGAAAFLDRVEQELRAVMVLVGARDLEALRRVPRMLGSDLMQWRDTARA